MSKPIIKWGLLVLVIVLAVPVFYYSQSLKGANPLPIVSGEVSVSVPIRIIIPAILVDAVVEQVFLTPTGLMDVPKLPINTGWYANGTIPGQVGSAVVDGHVNGPKGEKAVFSELAKLKPGDKVIVEDMEGSMISFTVRNLRKYDSNQEASDVFTSTDGIAHLNLITCSGVWDRSAQDYPERLVVFTDMD